jgi:hypothetical protein
MWISLCVELIRTLRARQNSFDPAGKSFGRHVTNCRDSMFFSVIPTGRIQHASIRPVAFNVFWKRYPLIRSIVDKSTAKHRCQPFEERRCGQIDPAPYT